MKVLKYIFGYYYAKLPELFWFGDASPYGQASSWTFMTIHNYMFPLIMYYLIDDDNGVELYDGLILCVAINFICFFIGFFFKDFYYKLKEKHKYDDNIYAYFIFLGSFLVPIVYCIIRCNSEMN